MNPQDPKDAKLDELGLPKPVEPFHSQEQVGPEVIPQNMPSKEQLAEVMPEALVKTAEQLKEVKPEQIVPVVPEQPRVAPVQEQQPVATASAAVVITKDPLVAEIESILSHDLEKDYAALPPSLQQKFRVVGEKTAIKIRGILAKSKINLKKIAHLIIKWLRIIPHVNKYFLIQEAKIKADEIAKLKKV